MIGIASSGILRLDHVQVFLDRPIRRLRPFGAPAPEIEAVAGWGMRPTTDRLRGYARQHHLPFVALEDGFVRSVGLGGDDPPLSLVVDDLGIYYNATAPSRLEALIPQSRTATQCQRARDLIQLWQRTRVSKYNHNRDFAGILPRPYVLVADQTLGDMSIRHGLAATASFHRMLDAAWEEYPEHTILLKVHPEVLAGRKQGHFDLHALRNRPRVQVLGEDVHPASLLEQADALYVVTSQMGFEGLLWGKPVRTFGMPFYAGWGLTDDDQSPPARRQPTSLENLVHASLIDYPRYIDPETHQRCEAERVIDWLGLQRRMRERFPALVYGLDVSLWKKPIVRDFFQGSRVHFVATPRKVPDHAVLGVWGRREPAADPPLAQRHIRLVRLEDGFLRSVGLGADLVRPLSWVMDDLGIYYDATQTSRLEQILQNDPFEAPLLARACALRASLRQHGLTKYNVGQATWQRPSRAGQVILVPGQVESDASIAYGAPGLRKNIDLLRAVRQANPQAHVVYKPHPDVVAGLRKQGTGEDEARQWCDEMVVDCVMGHLLEQVDEVHILTSLAGFEALLRGKQVVTYGMPFYAGWGLTRDQVTCDRRRRQLTLDQLVAGVLILYPAYVSRTTNRFTTPEQALVELLAWRAQGVSTMPLWRKGLRLLLRLMFPPKN